MEDLDGYRLAIELSPMDDTHGAATQLFLDRYATTE